MNYSPSSLAQLVRIVDIQLSAVGFSTPPAVMRALRYYGPKDLRLEKDLPEPKCGPMQVKIKPAFVGICGTDLHEYHSQTFVPKQGAPHALSNESAPITLGHELSGIIVEIGSDVSNSSDLKVGDRVAVFPLLYCRTCVPCKDGLINCCVQKGFMGLSGGGGLSDYLCVGPEAVFKLPDSMSLEVGALVEPLAVAWHAVSESGIKAGQACLVFGTGPIGLAIIQCLRAIGAGDNIIAVEIAARRQQFAKQFGATHILDPTRVDVIQEARELTGGYGPPVAFDCAGVPSSLESTIRAVCARGTIVNVAIWEKPVPFHPNNLVLYERKYVGCLTYQLADFGHVIDAIHAGRLRPESMITSKISIDHVVEDGFEALMNEKDKHVKLMVDLLAL